MANLTTTTQVIAADFVERLTDEMLMAPDPELIFARWARSAALEAEMASDEGFELAKLQLLDGRIATSGAPANISEAMSQGMGGSLLVSLGMSYPDMFKMVKEAKGPGEVIKIPRPRFLDGATTESARQLRQQDTLFGNTQPVSLDQVDITIREYAGPGDPSTGAPTPISVPLFSQNRAQHDLLSYVGLQLRRDRYRFLDDLIMSRLIAAASANASGITRGGGVASNAAFTGNGNEPFTFELTTLIVEAMKGRYIPGIGGDGKYVAVLDIHQVQQLQNDPAYQRLAVFQPELNPLIPGYVKTCGQLVVCQSNRMTRLSNLGGGAVAGYQGIVFAPGVLGWALAMDATAVRDKNDDGGRFAKFGWLSFEGLETLDDRFCQLVITT